MKLFEPTIERRCPLGWRIDSPIGLCSKTWVTVLDSACGAFSICLAGTLAL